MAKSLSQLLKNLRGALAREAYECESLPYAEQSMQLDKNIRKSLAADLPDPKTAPLAEYETYVKKLCAKLGYIRQEQRGLAYQHCLHFVSGYYKLTDDAELREAAQEDVEDHLGIVSRLWNVLIKLKEQSGTASEDIKAQLSLLEDGVRELKERLEEIKKLLEGDNVRQALAEFTDRLSESNPSETESRKDERFEHFQKLDAMVSAHNGATKWISAITLLIAALRDAGCQVSDIFKGSTDFLKSGKKQLTKALNEYEDKLNTETEVLKSTIASMDDTLSKVKKMRFTGGGTSDISSTNPEWASDSGTDTYGGWAEFEYKGIRQRLRWCLAGKFMMGSPKDEEGRHNGEGPQTEVTFKSGFWMFDTAVTQELYTAVMRTNPSHFQTGEDAGKRPVENVSWNDAQVFLQKLNKTVSRPPLSLSLPSEAEWEYACRAGMSGPRYADDLDAIAWYDENSNMQTYPVAQKAANLWGLYDTLGNVREWCADAWKDNHEGADPTGLPRQAAKSVTTFRVVRGGAWFNSAQGCRAAYRGRFAPDFRDGILGFRPIQQVSKQRGPSGDAGATPEAEYQRHTRDPRGTS